MIYTKFTKHILILMFIFGASITLTGCNNFCDDSLSDEGFSKFERMKMDTVLVEDIMRTSYQNLLMCSDTYSSEDLQTVAYNCKQYYDELADVHIATTNKARMVEELLSCSNINYSRTEYLSTLNNVWSIYARMSETMGSLYKNQLAGDTLMYDADMMIFNNQIKELEIAQPKLQSYK